MARSLAAWNWEHFGLCRGAFKVKTLRQMRLVLSGAKESAAGGDVGLGSGFWDLWGGVDRARGVGKMLRLKRTRT